MAAASNLIDGKQIAQDIRAEIKVAVDARAAANQPVPGLAVVLVGSRRDSQTLSLIHI